MKKIGKKILAVLLSACLLSAYCSMTAFAGDDDTTASTEKIGGGGTVTSGKEDKYTWSYDSGTLTVTATTSGAYIYGDSDEAPWSYNITKLVIKGKVEGVDVNLDELENLQKVEIFCDCSLQEDDIADDISNDDVTVKCIEHDLNENTDTNKWICKNCGLEAQGAIGDCSWKYSGSTLTISGSGSMGDYEDEYDVPWYAFRKYIENVKIENGVTSIGNNSFGYCYALTDVTISGSVKTIGERAFFYCEALKSVTIPEGVVTIGKKAFQGCKALESVTIPYGVTSIGTDAFNGCKALESVTIPDSVTTIGENVFESCRALQSVTISNNITEISLSTFSNCSALKSVTIPNGVTSIGRAAFNGCTALESVTIPDSVQSIGDMAFYQCSALPKITIPSSVTEIGGRAFYECRALTEITIPSSVTSIGNYAFIYCRALTKITIPSSVTSIGNYAFSSCSKLTEITIPSSVTSIGNYAFSSCTSLKMVTIEASNVSVGTNAFNGCTALESITVPCDSSNAIGDFKTAGATNLENLTKPDHKYDDDVCTDCGQQRFQEKGGYIYISGSNNTKIASADSDVTAIDLTKIESVTSIADDVFEKEVVVYVAEGKTINTGENNNVVVKYVTDSEKLGIKINNDTADSTYKFSVVVNTINFGGSKEADSLYLDEVDVIDNEVGISKITNYTTVADDDNNIYFKVTYVNPEADSTVRGQVQVKEWDGENLSDVIYYVTKPYTVGMDGTITKPYTVDTDDTIQQEVE